MILRGFLLLASSTVALWAQPAFESVRHEGSFLVFRFSTETNQLYVLDEAASLAAPWTENMVFSGTGTAVKLTNDLAGGTRFFRARTFPPLVSKPGTFVQVPLALTNSSAEWTVDGELPEGVFFTNGVFVGSPAAAAAEKHTSGDYTNVVYLSIPGVGEQLTRTSSAEIVHHVKLSFSRNIYPARPNGPSLGAICIECHGSGFAPDYRPDPSTLINVKAGSAGICPSAWDYVHPGDPQQSLVYLKVIAPPCGDRMPQGGPYLNATQIGRLGRWIRELAPNEGD